MQMFLLAPPSFWNPRSAPGDVKLEYMLHAFSIRVYVTALLEYPWPFY